VKSESEVSVTEFAGLFVQGNPIYALENMVRYYRARDERATVVLTEKLAQPRSPLTIDELLEALNDPRYNVRFEAAISIARMNPHPRLIEALSNLVSGTELSLSAVAAWGLGRMGSEDALPALRRGLDSDYRSIRGQCARTLGTLGDRAVIPLLHERLRGETDRGLQMAYASALGNLRATEAIDTLFDLLRDISNEGARMELALSLGRMIGAEAHFVRLLRQVRADTGTAVARELIQLRGHLGKSASSELVNTLAASSEAFAREKLDEGIEHLVAMIRGLPPSAYFTEVAESLLRYCADGLEAYGSARIEYLILVLHALHSGAR